MISDLEENALEFKVWKFKEGTKFYTSTPDLFNQTAK